MKGIPIDVLVLVLSSRLGFVCVYEGVKMNF